MRKFIEFLERDGNALFLAWFVVPVLIVVLMIAVRIVSGWLWSCPAGFVCVGSNPVEALWPLVAGLPILCGFLLLIVYNFKSQWSSVATLIFYIPATVIFAYLAAIPILWRH